jgi:hypothetical protein
MREIGKIPPSRINPMGKTNDTNNMIIAINPGSTP